MFGHQENYVRVLNDLPMALLRGDNHLLHNVSYKDVSVFFYYYIEYSISLGILHAETRRFSYSSTNPCSSFQGLLVHSLKELPVLADL